MSNNKFVRVCVAFVLMFGVLIISISASNSHEVSASGNAIVVTSLADAKGICPGSSCTLRAAIDAANNSGIPTTITFGISGTIALSSTLRLADYQQPLNVVIDGNGQTIAVDGKNSVQVFDVEIGTVTLRDLTIENGQESGLYNNNGTVALDNCTFMNNTAHAGGGIYNQGILIVNNSVFNGNSAANFGGGIFNFGGGTLVISNSLLSGNIAFGGGGVANGGGITSIGNTTIINNSATDNVQNGVVTSSGSGGGIANLGGGKLNLVNTIVAKNTATNGPDIYGSGINSLGYNLIGNGTNPKIPDATGRANNNATATAIIPTLTQVAQLQAQITATAAASMHISPPPPRSDAGYNAQLTAVALPGPVNGINGDQVGTAASPIDPMLGNLASTGGSTLTMVLLPGSPAIGKGDCSGNASVSPPIPAVTIDQRGVPRGNPCSIGAFEGSAAGISTGTITATPGS